MDQMDSASASVEASNSASNGNDILSLPLASKSTTHNGKIAWPGGPAEMQNFSLPSGIIYYMAKNPSSPEGYLKIAMSCKYFFEMLPLLIVKRINVDKNGKRMCSKDGCECYKKNHKCSVNIDFAKITKSKIWITHQMFFSFNGNIPPSLLLPKLYGYQNAIIKFYRKEMTMKEFELWGSTFTKFAIYKSKVIGADGNVVTIDSIFKAMANIKQLAYFLDDDAAALSPSTMKNVLKLKNFEKLGCFCLFNIPDIVAVKDLSAFVKAYKDSKIMLVFHLNISDEYKLQLNKLVNDIITSKVPNRLIKYPGQDKEMLILMKSRCYSG